MSSPLQPLIGYILLGLYGLFMIAITHFFARRKRYHTVHRFLVAERDVSWWLGATSIAASWIWAPALFVSVQSAYQQGLAGIFWFTVPNIFALILYIFLAPKIRTLFPNGYTLPHWIQYRLQSESVHKMYLFPYFFYQLMAVAVQLFAGGHLVSFLTGIPFINAMIIMAATVLTYSLISGLESSIVTDFIQFLLIVMGVGIVVPWTIYSAGGWSSVQQGFGGITGQLGNIFDPGVAFSFGIVTSIGLISGAISDQQYWQRAFAMKRSNLVPSFLFGALMFGIVPIALSSLGFLAANRSLGITLPEGTDVSMIGIATVGHFLPASAITIFVVMLLSALYSTMDSGLNAVSSLWVTDVVRKTDDDVKGISHSRGAMFVVTVLGLLVAIAAETIPGFGLKHLWWIFNTVAACVVVPTVLSLYWKGLDARGVFWGILLSFIVGTPLFIVSNILDKPLWIVSSSLFMIAISTVCCFLFPNRNLGGTLAHSTS
jgi:urea-proton symporter